MSFSWPVTTLGEITDLITKGTTPTSVGFEFVDAGINFVKVESIDTNGRFIPAKFDHIDDTCNAALRRSQLAAGDILFSIAGALGRTAKVTPDILPANTNQALAIVRLKNSANVIPEFVLYALSPSLLYEQIEKQRGGVAQQNLSLTQLKGFRIPLPPLTEQQRIVAILDEAFAGLATATANAEKNLKNARELFDSYLNSIFEKTGGDWKETTLGSEMNLLVGFAFKSAQYTKGESGVRLLRGDNVVQNALRWDDVKRWPASDVKSYEAYKLEVGDLVLAMDRTWVKAGLKYAVLNESDVPCLLVQRVARLRCRDQLDNRFLVHLIGSPKFTQYVLGIQTGLSVPHISGKQISDFAFRKPKILEQRKIGTAIDELASNVAALESTYREKLVFLADLKQSILHKAFSGELTSPPSQIIKEAAE